MKRSRSSRRSMSLALLAAGALACSAAAARAQEDGQGSIVGSLMGMVGLGKQPVARGKIDYRERSPIVLPKSMDLPTPAATTSSDAAWPKDPDALAASRAEAEARAPVSALLLGEDDPPSFRDMQKDRGAAPSQPPSAQCQENDCDPHQIWAQLKIKKGDPGSMQEATAFVPGKEPKRAYLTEPPPGYLTPTQAVKPTWEARRDKDAEQNSSVYYLHQAGQKAGTDN